MCSILTPFGHGHSRKHIWRAYGTDKSGRPARVAVRPLWGVAWDSWISEVGGQKAGVSFTLREFGAGFAACKSRKREQISTKLVWLIL